MKILFTGGGTGGHIYPIAAVVDRILDSGVSADLYYVGVPGVYEQMLTSRGISVHRIVSAKLRSGALLRNLLDVPLFFVGLAQALWRIFWIMPDVLFSKGGPGALPVVLACAFYRIPIIVHESDSVVGRTNRISGRFAERIGIAFASAQESFLGGITNTAKRAAMERKIALIGNPIRDQFFATSDATTKATIKRTLDFDPARPLLLIIGGSQGSVRVNDFFLSIAEELLNRNVQVIHQTGTANSVAVQTELHAMLQKYSSAFQHSYRVVPYFGPEIKDMYLAADLAVSRAGSGAIFELAASGCPAILIPLPEAAQNHQVKNAFEYASTGAAIALEEINLTKHIFLTQLDRLLADPAALATMSAAAKSFAHPQAAELLAKEIMTLANRS